MNRRFWKLCLFFIIGIGPVLGQSKKPLREADVIDLLRNYVPPARVAELSREKGINFSITYQVETELKRAGADNALIKSLRNLAPMPEAKARKVNPKGGQKYVWIRPGTFQIGCSPGDGNCDEDEKPAHTLTITKGFWMAQTVVTVDAWKRYRLETAAKALPESDRIGRTNWNEANGNGSIPVVMLTWDEAKTFCEWTGGRLPTDAEWEYAARAGNPNARYGDLGAVAWYQDNSGDFVHPVGQKIPNAWGLYDMLGNVWQWTSDWYGKEERFRVLRGGSWDSNSRVVRVSFRYRLEPSFTGSDIGARCVGR